MENVVKIFLREIVPGDNPNIDIVAVHGLNPLNKDFHADSTWTADGKLWLRDFLPIRLPSARVLLFGYNSNVAFDTSIAGVNDHALNLLNRLELKRKFIEERPIIFVAHSLGGIIVKTALVEAKLNDQYNQIRKATYGVTFFGTPHRGGNRATLGDVAANIVRTVLGNQDNSIMSSLKKNSPFLENLDDCFKHQLEDYHVLSFYETRSFKNLGLVVDKRSATFGLAGTREKQIPIEADHSHICKFKSPHGDDYEQVSDNLILPPKSAVKHFHTQNPQIPVRPRSEDRESFIVPYSRNLDFVGREDILKQLIGRVYPHAKQQSRVALFGLGGVGKTQLAIEYAYWLHENQQEVYILWVHANSSERFQQSFVEIARGLKIPGTEMPKVDILALVYNADDHDMLFNTSTSSDNGKIRRGLAEYIPDRANSSILVTTRNKKVAAKFTRGRGLLKVQEMNEIEARQLVQRILVEDEHRDEDINELAEELEHLPLALVQASAGNKDNAIELLSQDFNDSGRNAGICNAVATTWMISFKQIQLNNPYAADLLSLIASLDRSGIPEELLRQQHKELSGTDFEQALGDLKAFSLINETSVHMGSGIHRAFGMHRMVQLVTQQWLNIHGETKVWAENALIAVSKVFPPDQSEHWKTSETYMPHVQVVVDREIESASAARFKADLLHNASWYFRVKGFLGRAELMGREAVKIREQMFGAEDRTTLSSMYSLSRTLFEQSKIDESEALVSLVVHISGVKLGGTSVETLGAISHLAAIRGVQGRYEEVENLEVEALGRSTEIFGECHLVTLHITRDLAITYGRRNQHERAEALQFRVLAERKKILGDDHPETLIIMNDLAVTYGHLGRIADEGALEMQIIETSKRTLGGEHPHTIEAMRRLNAIYKHQGRTDKATELEERILEATKPTRDDEPSTASRVMSDSILTYRNIRVKGSSLNAYRERQHSNDRADKYPKRDRIRERPRTQ